MYYQGAYLHTYNLLANLLASVPKNCCTLEESPIDDVKQMQGGSL